jgi:multisubunit Na+/H+ antiporter MnhF subunit
MNVWLIAATIFLLCLVPCGIGVMRGTVADRLIALEAGTIVSILTLLTLEQGLGRESFFDLSLSLAVLTIASTLVFTQFYRRWL